MHRLLIIGAGGFGREILAWAQDVPREQRNWEIGGFLDANPAALSDYECKVPIFADPLSYQPIEGDRFVCAIGDPKTKLRICKTLKERGAEFITLVHPSAVIGNRCTLGEGCIMCPGSVLTADVKIHDFVTLNVKASVGHDAIVGEGSTLSGHVDITGFAQVGIGVFLGSHAVVLPKMKVGDYATVGAGSVVVKKVKPGTTVFGVPARQMSGF